MFHALASSYTGIKAHQLQLDNAAHNIANVETCGYKERQLTFQDLHYMSLTERRLPNLPQQLRPLLTGIGTGNASSVAGHHRQGPPLAGSRPTEIAIQGSSF